MRARKLLCAFCAVLVLTDSSADESLSSSTSLSSKDMAVSVCMDVENLVTKYVNSICRHQLTGRYVMGGLFNRVGNNTAQHLVILNHGLTTALRPRMGPETKLPYVLQHKDEALFSIVSAVHCPDDPLDPYVYVGGVFEYVTTNMEQGNAEQILVNNFARIEVATGQVSALSAAATNKAETGFTKSLDESVYALVRTIACAGPDIPGRRCEQFFTADSIYVLYGPKMEKLSRLKLFL